MELLFWLEKLVEEAARGLVGGGRVGIGTAVAIQEALGTFQDVADLVSGSVSSRGVRARFAGKCAGEILQLRTSRAADRRTCPLQRQTQQRLRINVLFRRADGALFGIEVRQLGVGGVGGRAG